MRRRYRKIFLSSLVLIALVGGWAYCKWTGRISHVKVRATKSGWICSGPIQWEFKPGHAGVILGGPNLHIVEKYHRRSLSYRRSLRQFPRHRYYVTGLRLSSGDKAYRTRMNIKGHRLQLRGIWPWGEYVVIWGYYQEKPGLFNHKFWITILDSQGRVLKQFPLDNVVRPMAVDEKNGLLLCLQDRSRADIRGPDLDPFVLKILELPSGEEKERVQLRLLFGMVTDKDGNVYVLRRLKSIRFGETEGIYDALVEKYSTVPWKKHWSERLTGTVESYPRMLKYEEYEDGLLWYATEDKHAGPYPEDRRKWKGALDPETGERVETERKCDPYRIETEFEGRRYVVTKKDDKLHVRIVPLKEDKQP